MNDKLRLVVLIALIAAVLAGALYFYRSVSPAGGGPAGTPAGTEPAAPAPSSAQASPTQTPAAAPDFTVYDGGGTAVTLSSFEGRPAVVNFWASWCGYCLAEMPEYQAAFEKYGDGVAFLMVDLTVNGNDTREDARKVLSDGGYAFPVYYDDDGSAAAVYGIRSIPMSYFIDADGNIVDVVSGPVSAETLTDTLEAMLADSAA